MACKHWQGDARDTPPVPERARRSKAAASSRVFFSFQDECGPSMNTEPLGHVASNFMAQVTASDVAISKHLPLFTQTRQGLEKKMVMEEYDNPLLWRLWTWA
jgi:hypothetical protein